MFITAILAGVTWIITFDGEKTTNLLEDVNDATNSFMDS